jgi:hypothetical protein
VVASSGSSINVWELPAAKLVHTIAGKARSGGSLAIGGEDRCCG